jgi:hypothetical protein
MVFHYSNLSILPYALLSKTLGAVSQPPTLEVSRAYNCTQVVESPSRPPALHLEISISSLKPTRWDITHLPLFCLALF